MILLSLCVFTLSTFSSVVTQFPALLLEPAGDKKGYKTKYDQIQTFCFIIIHHALKLEVFAAEKNIYGKQRRTSPGGDICKASSAVQNKQQVQQHQGRKFFFYCEGMHSRASRWH